MKLIVELIIKTPLRVGVGNETDDTLNTVRSTTIYSAIIYNAFRLFGDDAHKLAKSLKVSSLLFKFGEEYLIPKPFLFNTYPPEKLELEPKKLKKAQYVFASKLSNNFKESIFFEDSPVKIDNRLVVSLDRVRNTSSLYNIELIYFKDKFTPYFIAEFPDDLENHLKASVRLLGDSGLGADATRGFGLFEPKFKVPPDIFHKNGTTTLLLGLARPNEDEIRKLNNGYYKLVKLRGHRHIVPKLKNELYYLSEGSTFDFNFVGEPNKLQNDYYIIGSTVVFKFDLGGDLVE
ncbi:type III-A CRISPR-associated RAMP protein Csm4 [Thermosipho affectus]|uniref:type III-A CRISPR-associated RAMP protein Csm4 n=1 Tax=Thermosipho affectus TaxID=660294 RepID=UPI000A078267|nr:type III-A CRISPR-associated RAMP protein Csm4 [Thermosipho affectus]